MSVQVTTFGFDEWVDALEDLKDTWGQADAWITGVGAEYGPHLEFGTVHMEPRPFLEPAAREAAQQASTLFKQAVRTRTPTQTMIQLLALQIETIAKLSITTGSKSGRIYERGGKQHQASAPGEAPASDTGNLANSIKAESYRGS